MLAVGRFDLSLPARAAFEPLLAHQSLHSLMIAFVACPTQLMGNPRTAIVSLLIFIDTGYLLNQLSVGCIPRCRSALAPAIVPATRHFQDLAQPLNRIFFGKLFHHLISLLGCSETIKMVFFKMSRCVITRASSLRSS